MYAVVWVTSWENRPQAPQVGSPANSCSHAVGRGQPSFFPLLAHSIFHLISRHPAPPPRAADPAVSAPKWWDSHPDLPNLRTIEGGLDALLTELKEAGDALVIIDVYGTWCGACKAVFPKFVQQAGAHPDVVFLKLPFDENKAVAKALGVKALPAFICLRGADGKLETFTAGPSKAGVLAAAIERHNSPRCQLGGPAGSPELNALASERRTAAEAALAGAAGAGVA